MDGEEDTSSQRPPTASYLDASTSNVAWPRVRALAERVRRAGWLVPRACLSGYDDESYDALMAEELNPRIHALI